MAIPILMPALSPTMTSGNLAKWLKNEGEMVKPGEIIAEIETDKATMEVDSADSGRLVKICVIAGTMNVAVNTLIAVLLEDGEDESVIDVVVQKYQSLKPSEKKPEAAGVIVQNDVASVKMGTPHADTGRIKASPLAKKIAKEKGIDLSMIRGTGPNGRIVKQDLMSCGATPKTGGRTQRAVPQSIMRSTIARRLVESKQNIPHFYLTAECNLTSLLACRNDINAAATTKNDTPDYRISVNDFIIKAAAYALKKVPEANSAWGTDEIIFYDYVDVSVAVSVGGGLITPIIRDPDSKTLIAISREARELVKKARNNQLKTEEFQGGTFTISNMGMYEVKEFAAIINPPQAAILAVGAAQERVIVKDGQMVIAPMMSITLSCDHRVIDGSVGADLLMALKYAIENPVVMLAS